MAHEPGTWERTRPHPIQVRLAFGGDREHAPQLAEIESCEANGVVLRGILDSVARRFTVADPARLQRVLEREDVCRWQGRGALALVNPRYRVLAIAVGPSVLPRRLEVNYGVARLEDGAAVEMPSHSPDQPSWYVLSAEETASEA